MTYFLLLPGDTDDSVMYETNLLGETSFKVFWAGQALSTLIKILDTNPEILPTIRIINDKRQNISIEEFLKAVEKLEIRQN